MSTSPGQTFTIREATREDLPDATDRITEGGFGSGQGMELGNIGQDPDHPNERGYPRGKDPNWPA